MGTSTTAWQAPFTSGPLTIRSSHNVTPVPGTGSHLVCAGRVQQVGFQNVGTSNTAFCLGQLALTGGSPPSHVLAGVTASAQGSYPGAVTPLTSTAVL